MKDQVTTIEQSKRLIELGVPAGKASMFIVGDVGVYPRFYVEAYPNLRSVPAFTVADLLGMIPKTIITPQDKVHTLHIEACSSTSPSWCLFWGDEEVQIGWQERMSISHLLEDAIEWLVLKGYRLNV